MVLKTGIPKEVLLHLFRNPFTVQTITSLTENLKRSRVGVWKTIKNLEKDNYLKLKPLESLRKKVYTIGINWDNPLVEKTLEMYLVGETLNYDEWTKNFKNLGNVLDFLILSKGKESHKIIGVTQKGKFIRIQKPANIEELEGKEVETSSVTNLDFFQGLKNQKEEYAKALGDGIILFGQDSFIRFMKQVHLNK
jgi:hypothetical protein